jgi:two-component system sensor kinase FixL|tara:strand:- start:1978 stop:4032 length:2055 start_codon:yes stop_codon:yes gene_type:complete
MKLHVDSNLMKDHDSEDLVNDEIQSLRRDRDRLLQGLDSLPGLVGYVDLDLKIVFANRLIEQWYQRPLKDLVGMHLKTLFTEEHFCTVEALLKRVLSGEAINEEREICYPDGITRMVHLNYMPDSGSSSVIGYFFLVRDVSQRHSTELALKKANKFLDQEVRSATAELQLRNDELLAENLARRESEDRYRIVSELTSDLIYVYQIDKEGSMKTTWFTGRLSKEFSPTQTEDGHQRMWGPIVHPDDEDILTHRFERLMNNSSSVDEFRVIDKKGETRWMRAYGRPIWGNKEQRVVQIMVATQDITSTKNVEQQLDRNRQMLSAALDSMSEGFMLFNDQGALIEFNEKLNQLFPKTAPYFVKGVHFDELLKRSAYSGEVKDALGDPEQWMQKRLKKFPSESGSVEVELADGRWILSTDRLTRDNGIVAIRSDITDRKKAEALRRFQEAELAHILRRASMGEMASALAHELSQPLAVVVNYANGLLRRLDDESGLTNNQTREALSNITRAGQRAKDIISHVGDFVRQGDPEVTPHSIRAIINGVHQLLRDTAERHSIKLNIHFVPKDFLVAVNKIEIEQVLFNLVTNSIDSIQQAACNIRQIDIVCKFDDEFLTLTISDTGPGVDPAILETMFDTYITTKSRGLGMGLSISRTIIEAHGGRLWLDATFCKGARLCVRLPITRNDKKH